MSSPPLAEEIDQWLFTAIGWPAARPLAAETEAREAYSRADLVADGSFAAELEKWLSERELDLQQTTLSNYRDGIGYINPHLGSRQAYTLDKRAIHDLYLTLLKRGSRRGSPLARETVRTVHRVLMKALKDMGITIEGVREPRPEDKETQGAAKACGRLLAPVDGVLAWTGVLVVLRAG